MGKARVAYLLSFAFLLGVGIPGFAYLSIVLFSRPLHSGITPDIIVAIVAFLVGTSVGSTCTVLRRRWRTEFLGQVATVGGMTRGPTARVVVAGIPYWAFIKEPVRKGDKVVLTSTTIEGAPVRTDFVAEKVTDSARDAGARTS